MIVKSYMTPNPITVEEGTSINITESDIFAALVAATGVKEGGIEIELELPDTPANCKAVGDIIKEHGFKIRSSLCHFDGVREGYRRVAFRVVGQDLRSFVEWLRSEYTVVNVSEN